MYDNFRATVFPLVADFSYEDPDRWAETDPDCGGSRQSPIDIELQSTTPAVGGGAALQLDGSARKPVSITVTNNGHTAQYTFDWSKDSERPRLTGGPLGQDPYVFEQLHFHWGAENDRGSEHTFNGLKFPLEAHFVFFKQEYGSFEQAVNQPDGLAVLGALYEVGGIKIQPGAKWARPLPKVREAGSSITLEGRELFSLDSVAGAEWDRYYSYPGSLTTPPCAESVTWLVRLTPALVAQKDLDLLRALHDSDGKPLVDNFRPVQPLNDRTVVRYGF
ncbi:AGAP013402-PA-like protein [Anopheles sinensis]|uniref:AGAP013402-PA-like protein n=1 Tax=Anopheles sinensis TaxID=74873 RepID=A0A084VJQ9_ANOSI|nr:AGAP013402-PA-like protein [Anopheles sinensis]